MREEELILKAQNLCGDIPPQKRNLKITLNEKQFEDFRDIFDNHLEEIIIKKGGVLKVGGDKIKYNKVFLPNVGNIKILIDSSKVDYELIKINLDENI